MIHHQNSHIDHGLSNAQIRYLIDRFADRKTFFLETLELPAALGTVSCALWGPAMGDPAVAEEGSSTHPAAHGAGRLVSSRGRHGRHAWSP